MSTELKERIEKKIAEIEELGKGSQGWSLFSQGAIAAYRSVLEAMNGDNKGRHLSGTTV